MCLTQNRAKLEWLCIIAQRSNSISLNSLYLQYMTESVGVLVGVQSLPPVSIDHMMTSSNGNIFRVTGPLCGEFTAPGEFLAQRPVTRSFDVFFDLHLNRRLSTQPWGWWFETPSLSLWRQCYDRAIRGVLCQNRYQRQGQELTSHINFGM